MLDLVPAAERIVAALAEVTPGESLLVGMSGIDASGKGYTSKRLVAELQGRGIHAVEINLDGWLKLPKDRFGTGDPAEGFYRVGFRFDEMFERLILPLKRTRGVALDADFATETGTSFQPYRYEFRDVDVIVLEGVFLYKREYRGNFDLAIWVDCSFETSLERALIRQQEGLGPEETIAAFETIYYPAQRIHFAIDDPRGSADLVLINDDRLASGASPAL